MMRSANPALHAKTFSNAHTDSLENRMTLSGAVNKTFALIFLLVGSASVTWNFVFSGNIEAAIPWIGIGVITAFIIGLVLVFKPGTAPITAPLYALAEGFLLGAVSAMYEQAFSGIVLQAVVLTIGTLLVLLLAYKSHLIKVTENLKLGIVAATGGVVLLYLFSIILSFFGIQTPFLHDNGPVGIIIGFVIVGIAAFNLVLDFDFIEEGVAKGAPKYMEWYAGFGLLVTLIWLYMEILRLLSKLRSRD